MEKHNKIQRERFIQEAAGFGEECMKAAKYLPLSPIMPKIVQTPDSAVFLYEKNEERLEVGLDENGDGYMKIERIHKGNWIPVEMKAFIEFECGMSLVHIVNAAKRFMNPCVEKLCLFTGAFNPPTIAHHHMIESAMNAGNFDYVIFACSSQVFLNKKMQKKGKAAYTEYERIKMLLAMTRDVPKAMVFGAECGYTYNVLCAVKEHYKAKEVYFAMGSDKLKEIGRWGHHDKLLKEFCFYVLARGDSENYIHEKCMELFQNKWLIGKDNETYKDISSTLARERIKAGEDLTGVLPVEVIAEVQMTNLFF